MKSLILLFAAAGVVGLCASSAQAEQRDPQHRGPSVSPAVFSTDDGARVEQVRYGRRGGRYYGRSYAYRPYYVAPRAYAYPQYGYYNYGPSYGFGANSYRAYYGAPSYYGRSYGYRPYGYGYGGGYGRGYSGRGGVSIGIGF